MFSKTWALSAISPNHIWQIYGSVLIFDHGRLSQQHKTKHER